MSRRASDWAFKQLPNTPLEKNVLEIIAEIHNAETDQCNPSARLIQVLTRSKNERSVRRVLQSLEDQSFIHLVPEHGRSTAIKINWTRPGSFDWDTWRNDPGHYVRGGNLVLCGLDVAVAVEDHILTPDSMSGVPRNSCPDPSTPDMKSANPGHEVRTPRTLCPGTPDTMSDEPVINRVIEPVYEPEDDQIWDDTAVQKLLQQAGVSKVTTGMKISWQAQLLDWGDKGYSRINFRKKFIAHCVGCKNGSGQDLGIVETPGADRKREPDLAPPKKLTLDDMETEELIDWCWKSMINPTGLSRSQMIEALREKSKETA